MIRAMPALRAIHRANVVGSLLRPDELKQARAARDAGALSRADFKRVEDAAVDAAVALQEQAGIDVVTDGEMRRSSFVGPLSDVVDGVHPAEPLADTDEADRRAPLLQHPRRV